MKCTVVLLKCTNDVDFVLVCNLPLSLPLFLYLSVTLLDSVSALGDLGWEAYPAEGVSSTSRTDSNDFHRHRSRPEFSGYQYVDTLCLCDDIVVQ